MRRGGAGWLGEMPSRDASLGRKDAFIVNKLVFTVLLLFDGEWGVLDRGGVLSGCEIFSFE